MKRVAALDAPLQLADPHRDARQLGGVLVELDAQHVGRAGRRRAARSRPSASASRLTWCSMSFRRFSARYRKLPLPQAGSSTRKLRSRSRKPTKARLRVAPGLVAVLAALASAPRCAASSPAHSASSGRCTTGSTSRMMVTGSVKWRRAGCAWPGPGRVRTGCRRWWRRWRSSSARWRRAARPRPARPAAGTLDALRTGRR